MAEPISDRQLVAVLRPFVRACGPILDSLREAEPSRDRRDAEHGAGEAEPGLREKVLEGIDSLKIPGTTAWTEMNPRQRTDWWVNRVGRLTSLITAVPGLGGALADRLPVQDTLGAAAQGLLLCAIAGEHGRTGLGDRVRLVAWVLFEREIDPALAEGRHAEQDHAAEDRETAELTEDLEESKRRHGKLTFKAAARTLWRLGRSLLAITDELEKRPRGRFYHRALGMLPVVGMAGDYLGERSGLKRVTKRAGRWLARPQ